MRWSFTTHSRNRVGDTGIASCMPTGRCHSLRQLCLNPPTGARLESRGRRVPSRGRCCGVAMPRPCTTVVDVVRATLILVPVKQCRGAQRSFKVEAHPHSPISVRVAVRHDAAAARSSISVGGHREDRAHQSRALMVAGHDGDDAFILGQVPEAASYTEIRLYSSRRRHSAPVSGDVCEALPFGNP